MIFFGICGWFHPIGIASRTKEAQIDQLPQSHSAYDCSSGTISSRDRHRYSTSCNQPNDLNFLMPRPEMILFLKNNRRRNVIVDKNNIKLGSQSMKEHFGICGWFHPIGIASRTKEAQIDQLPSEVFFHTLRPQLNIVLITMKDL
jgi:hypothetical protein